MSTYRLFLVPLDGVEAAASPTRFTVRIVSNLEFPPGTSAAATITAAVVAHPLLGRGPAATIPAFAMEYGAWQSGGRVLTSATPGAIPVPLTYAGTKPLMSLRNTLASYLFRTEDTPVSPLSHDRRFDELLQGNFLDVAKVHDDLSFLRAELHESAVESFGFSRNLSPESLTLETFSYAQARWVNAHVQTLLIDAIFGRAGARNLAVRAEVADALDRVRSAVLQVQRRMSPPARPACRPGPTLRTATHGGEIEVSPRDPNVSMHAALKNDVLAEACGVITTWQADAQHSVIGDYVLTIDVSALGVDPAIATVVTQPTAFRRRSHTHPLSFTDVGRAETTNAGLAFLNDSGGNPRYRGTAINAETAIVQNTILQANNSISNSAPVPAAAPGGDFVAPRDDRPPQLLDDEQFGINEPESAGLTISAPTEDLMTPRTLADPQRNNILPCLFLEDLWVGYRLDLADEAGGQLLSIHRQTQEVTFRATQSKVRGETEDYFAREQPGDPASGVTSTEICRYQGLNSAQAVDYMRFLGTYKEPALPAEMPFTFKVVGYSDATPLRFGHIYKYRMRNVFLGGISLSDRDPNLNRYGSSYVQSCPFFRARAFRPGEVVSGESGSSTAPGGGGRTIFLTAEHPNACVWVVPTPVDSDTARYHGTFLASTDEPERNAHRSFVTDVGKFFKERPTKLRYFLDPEVNEIVVRVTMLNGDPDVLNHQYAYRDGSFCELAQHLRLPPVRARFGKPGNWEKFRPIEISFSATTNLHPRVTSKPGLGDAINVRVSVPPAADIEVSMIPVVAKAKLLNAAANAASSAQLALRKRRGPAAETWAPVPTIAENKLRVVHCLKRPALKPVIVNSSAQTAPNAKSVIIAERAKYKETAELHGYVQVDAASTGQVRLEASWSDIDDNPVHESFVSTAGTSASAPRSVSFDRYKPPSGALVARAAAREAAALVRLGSHGLSDMFGLQCAENKVFLGPATPQQLAPQASRPCILNFADMRRKQATVTAVATSRYKSHFSHADQADFEARSDTAFVEVPASMRLSSPDVSHVIPLSREFVQESGGSRRGRRVYAMRIYLRRPWFLSGPGERLAVGCRAGRFADALSASLDKYVTHWGEDPMERPKLDATRRSPRASDFRIPDASGDVRLDGVLYPARSLEGTSTVIYRDNLVRTEGDVDPQNGIISVASFALRSDADTKLWYCDVEVADGFIGWCGLALYRHQPHAHEGTQLSEIPAWVYGAVLYGEQVAWVKRNNKLQVTIGPVFDRYAGFVLDSTRYRHGVSENLRGNSHQRVTLQKYVANNQVYFEGIVATGESDWSLIKTRFGESVGSFDLNAG